MTNDSYEKRFPDLFELWTGHDLGVPRPGFGVRRPGFYGGLRQEDEPAVWRFIEENYLSRYEDLVRVAHEWLAEGLWGIPFPGSVSLGEYLSPGDFGMPDELTETIRKWQATMDRMEPAEETPDYKTLNAKGLEVAKQVKLFLGDDYYVEFRLFRGISVRGGEAVELEVPAFITDRNR